MDSFTYEALPANVVFGSGSRSALADAIDRLNARSVLILSGVPGIGLTEEIVTALGPRVARVLDDLPQYITRDLVDDTARTFDAGGTDCLLSVGGGSAIGLAKAVAVERDVPLVALPTTYSGSEMTPIYSVVVDGAKRTSRDLRALPRTVVYDPDVTMTLPTGLTTTSAFNALAHCIEGLYGPTSNPFTALSALEGARVLVAALPRVVASPGDLDARSDLLWGACLGGVSIAGGGIALHHKICHVLGAAHDLPHAALNAVILPYALAYNAAAIPDVMARLGSVWESSDPVKHLHALAVATQAPPSLRTLGMDPSDIDADAEHIAHAVTDNPRPVTVAGMTELLRAAHDGLGPGVLDATE